MRRLPLFGSLACLLGAASAHAQSLTEEAIRFQYQAPTECPDQAIFTARVRERTARGRIAEQGELARSFDVAISSDARGFSGSVAFLDDTGQSVSRRVHGEQCDELVSSLALITALALDASLRPEEAEPAATVPKPPAKEPPPAPVAEAVISVKRTRWSNSTGRRASARVGLVGGYGTLLDAFSVGLLGQLDWRTSLAIRITAHHASAEREVQGWRASLRLLGVETSLCVPGMLSRSLLFYVCPTLDIGTLRAQGLASPGLTTLDSSTIGWVAVGAELRLAWEPELPFWFELNGQLGAPLRKHRFVFKNPEVTVFEVGPPGLSAGAGIASGVRFW